MNDFHTAAHPDHTRVYLGSPYWRMNDERSAALGMVTRITSAEGEDEIYVVVQCAIVDDLPRLKTRVREACRAAGIEGNFSLQIELNDGGGSHVKTIVYEDCEIHEQRLHFAADGVTDVLRVLAKNVREV